MERENPTRTNRIRTYARRLGCSLGAVGAALFGFYLYQPYRFDLFPRTPPSPNPPMEPEPPRLFSRGVKVTVVTAHPDDSEFYLGGLLSRLHDTGADLSLIVTTDGDKAYIPWADHDRIRRVRHGEEMEAARRWGGREVIFLGYPDSRLSLSPELVGRIADALRRLKPEYVLLFDGDYPPRFSHRDHRTTGVATEQAVRQAGVGRWLLHYSTAAPNYAVDVTPEWPRKLELVHVHASEFSGDKQPRIDRLITGMAESQGRLLGVRYAEALRVARGPQAGR